MKSGGSGKQANDSNEAAAPQASNNGSGA